VELSVLLCSIRPGRVDDAIARIRPQLASFEHEILVVSPFEAAGPNVVWLREETPRGSVHAANFGFAAARGRLTLAMADDIAFDPDAVPTAARQLVAMRAAAVPCVGFAHRRGAQAYVNAAYGRFVPGFYLAPTQALRALGPTLCDPAFTVAWADQDLGLRIWEAGGRCEVADGATMELGASGRRVLSQGMTEANTRAEFERFRAKWGSSQPAYWGADIRSVAQSVARGFLPLIDPEGLTIDARSPEAAFDLRVAAAFTVFGDGAATPMPIEIARQGHAYLRWLAATADDPINVLVAARVFASVARVSELFGGARG
jgi:hypothetical protein